MVTRDESFQFFLLKIEVLQKTLESLPSQQKNLFYTLNDLTTYLSSFISLKFNEEKVVTSSEINIFELKTIEREISNDRFKQFLKESSAFLLDVHFSSLKKEILINDSSSILVIQEYCPGINLKILTQNEEFVSIGSAINKGTVITIASKMLENSDFSLFQFGVTKFLLNPNDQKYIINFLVALVSSEIDSGIFQKVLFSKEKIKVSELEIPKASKIFNSPSRLFDIYSGAV